MNPGSMFLDPIEIELSELLLESLKEKNINSTVKSGRGSVLVWACMSSSGVGNI